MVTVPPDWQELAALLTQRESYQDLLDETPGNFELDSRDHAVIYDFQGAALRGDGLTLRYTHRIWRLLSDGAASHLAEQAAYYDAGCERIVPVLARGRGEEGMFRALPDGAWQELPVEEDPSAPHGATRKLVASVPGVTRDSILEVAYFTIPHRAAFPGHLHLSAWTQAERTVVRSVRRAILPRASPVFVSVFGRPPLRSDVERAGRRWVEFKTDWRPPPEGPMQVFMPPPGEVFDRVEVSNCGTGAAVEALVRAWLSERGVPPPRADPASGAGALDRARSARRSFLRLRPSGGDGVPWHGPARPPSTVTASGYVTGAERMPVLLDALRRAGIPAFPVLASTDGRAPSAAHSPHSYDRALVAFRAEAGIVFLDPADDLLPAGRLPHVLEARPALLLEPGRVAAVRLPRSSASENRLRVQQTVRVTPKDGGACTARVTDDVAATGHFAARLRAALRVPAEAGERVSEALDRRPPDFLPLSCEPVGEDDLERPLRVRLTSLSKTRCVGSGTTVFLRTAREPEGVPVDHASRRFWEFRLPFVFEQGGETTYELPAGHSAEEPPGPFEARGAWGSVSYRAERVAETFRVRWTVSLSRPVVTPEEYPDLLQAFRNLELRGRPLLSFVRREAAPAW